MRVRQNTTRLPDFAVGADVPTSGEDGDVPCEHFRVQLGDDEAHAIRVYAYSTADPPIELVVGFGENGGRVERPSLLLMEGNEILGDTPHVISVGLRKRVDAWRCR